LLGGARPVRARRCGAHWVSADLGGQCEALQCTANHGLAVRGVAWQRRRCVAQRGLLVKAELVLASPGGARQGNAGQARHVSSSLSMAWRCRSQLGGCGQFKAGMTGAVAQGWHGKARRVLVLQVMALRVSAEHSSAWPARHGTAGPVTA